MRSLLTLVLLASTATAAQAQTSYNTVVEAAPTFDSTISAPIEYDANGVVKAQHFKAEDLTPEQLNALLAEADRVRSYQHSSGIYVRPETAAPSEVYEIELYETPVTANTYVESVPTASAPMMAAPMTTAQMHTVVKGDTLYNISKRYNLTVDALKWKNGLSDNTLSLGQVLTITEATPMAQSYSAPMTTYAATTVHTPSYTRIVEPVATTMETQSVLTTTDAVYAVLPKDTLYAISRRTCTKVAALISVNGITNPGAIKPGQRLTIPAGHCLKN